MIETITMTDDEMSRMPWTRDLMTLEQFERWVASRKEAGRAIDIETCEIGCWYANGGNPYLFGEYINGKWAGSDTFNFVRSPISNGWISETDLPIDGQFRALEARIERESGRSSHRA